MTEVRPIEHKIHKVKMNNFRSWITSISRFVGIINRILTEAGLGDTVSIIMSQNSETSNIEIYIYVVLVLSNFYLPIFKNCIATNYHNIAQFC